MNYNFEIKTNVSMNGDDFVDILSGIGMAVNYWCDGIRIADEPYLEAERALDSDCCIEDIMLYVLEHDREISYHDYEDNIWYGLTLEKFKNGIGMELSYNPDFECWDAYNYDNILQYALFGEIIYG